MSLVRALNAHEIPQRAPLRLKPGERVEVGERDTTWPAFVFVTTAAGQGWVPERHLREEEGRAVAAAGYDTTELATSVGEELAVLERDEVSGWLWCRSAQGREGWVPQSTVEPA